MHTNLISLFIITILGVLAGISIGLIVSVMINKSEDTKLGIIIAISMALSVLSGMTGVSLKYVIDSKIPFINKINPAAMITDSKPDVIIIDNDNSKLSNHFKNYFKKSAKVKDKDFTNDQIEDELFYRFSSYVIYIPKGFEQSIFDGNIKQIEYKSVDDYEASLASLTLNKYLSVGFYYSFMNYSLLAGCIYVLVVIISIFRKQNILQRNIISGMNYNKLNRELLLSGFLFAFFVWLIYVGISFIIGGKTVLTTNGICMIILSFIFLIYAISIGFLISNLLKSKNAINGIINVISLGSSFLCGVFVSLEFLPSSVLKLAHFIPNYYYIDGITKLSKMENISIDILKPLFSNIVILLISSLVFILLSFVISKKRRKLA